MPTGTPLVDSPLLWREQDKADDECGTLILSDDGNDGMQPHSKGWFIAVLLFIACLFLSPLLLLEDLKRVARNTRRRFFHGKKHK